MAWRRRSIVWSAGDHQRVLQKKRDFRSRRLRHLKMHWLHQDQIELILRFAIHAKKDWQNNVDRAFWIYTIYDANFFKSRWFLKKRFLWHLSSASTPPECWASPSPHLTSWILILKASSTLARRKHCSTQFKSKTPRMYSSTPTHRLDR